MILRRPTLTLSLTHGRRSELLAHQPFQSCCGLDLDAGQVDGAGVVYGEREGNLIAEGRFPVAIYVGGFRIAAPHRKSDSGLACKLDPCFGGEGTFFLRGVGDCHFEVDLDLE